jgi:multidrug resistance efflux pump
MKRTTWLAGAGLVALTVLNLTMLRSRAAVPVAAAAAPAVMEAGTAAGPGLIEAPSEEIKVSAEIGGRLDRVLVDEGDHVTAGQVLATIDAADHAARVASAKASLALREAELRRLLNGAREQERAEAAAVMAEADAVLANARQDQERRQNLLREAVVSRSEAEDADRAARVAQARADAARERYALVTADPREEDRARAESEVALARAALADADAQLAKTIVRAPIDGVILRRHRHAGESVSTQFDSPIVTMADASVRRVRVDVDEADVARVQVGQPAYVTADAFGDRRFPGHVVRVGRLLGKKNVHTDQASERVDTKVLETLVQLEDGRELPLGLRVQAFIVTSGESAQSRR